MCFNKLFFCIAFTLIVFQSSAQNCNLNINGVVIDNATRQPLPYVNVFIQEKATGTNTNDEGQFSLSDICPGHYHFIFSHIGCEAVKIHLDLYTDTLLNIELLHNHTSIDAIQIKGKKEDFIHQPNVTLSRKSIEENSSKNLSALLENENSVHTIKNGSGIAKPIVQGLYGNRLTILNNGVIQSGQQWGNDHSPEIDPFAADKITILKGASAISVGGGNLGNVILVEPKRVEREPHLHGQVNYTFESNGQGNIINARLQQYSPLFAWRINGTLKKYGDKKSANYYLNNTGNEEADFSLQLEKSWNENLFVDFYISTFNTRLGVLRGAHISNTTDLEAALNSEIPFYTEPNFSYDIEAPKQHVSHHLSKVKTKYFITDSKIVEFTLAGQLNNRKEFDIRRGDRDKIPALNLKQYTVNTDLKYTVNLSSNLNWQIGQQVIFTDNTNNPETGILPLIPDYLSWKAGLFSTLSNSIEKFDYNLGLRYDYEYQDVPSINNGVPPEIVRYNNNWHNVSALLSANYDLAKTQSINFSTGYTTRNPAINELYSSGLHQGVSGIEEGDTELKNEKLYKNNLEYKWLPNANFSISALVYHQHFNNYIFLNPQDEIRLTIRGAFPVFKYEQTNANIYGFDVGTQYTINNQFVGQLKYSYLKGHDIKNNQPLIFMPPNSFFGSLVYRTKQTVKLSKKVILEKFELEANNKYVFEQKNLLEDQDFVAAPASYNLFGIKASTKLIFPDFKLRVFAKADNLLNVQYRDYLNRQRYFADDIGLSIIAGVSLKF